MQREVFIAVDPGSSNVALAIERKFLGTIPESNSMDWCSGVGHCTALVVLGGAGGAPWLFVTKAPGGHLPS